MGKRYNPTKQYIREYTEIARDRLNLPDERIDIRAEGPELGSFSYGRWTPRRCRMNIRLIHGGALSVMYMGDWQIWVPYRQEWMLCRMWMAWVMLPDGKGFLRMLKDTKRKQINIVARLLAIDAERPLTYNDVRKYLVDADRDLMDNPVQEDPG